FAEVALEEVAQEIEKLHRDRLVEAELVIDTDHVLVDGVDAQKRAGGIARQQAHEHEGNQHDENEGRHDLCEPDDKIVEAHETLMGAAGSRMESVFETAPPGPAPAGPGELFLSAVQLTSRCRRPRRYCCRAGSG